MKHFTIAFSLFICFSSLAADEKEDSWKIASEAAAKNLPKGELKQIDDPLTLIKSIIEQKDCPDSFHLVDIGHLSERMLFWKKNLPSVTPFYAVKTNHDPIIVAVLGALGAGFDCASKPEIEEVLSLGIDPSRIVFAHPRKPHSAIAFAKEKGVDLMVFDSTEELDKMLAINPGGQFLLRIATDDQHSATPLSVKFGAPLDEAYRILDDALSKRVNVVGISFHVGSNCTHIPSYQKGIEDAASLTRYAQERWNVKFSLLDLGGGWPGIDDQAFTEIANTVEKAIKAHFLSDVRVIAEPGRYFATGTMIAAVRILGKKVTQNKKEKEIAYYLSNGTFGLFIGTLYYQYDPEKLKKEGFDFQPVKTPREGSHLYKSTLWGPTCDSGDRLSVDPYFPEMESGDFIYSKNVGAYTFAAQTTFNQIPPSQPFYFIKRL